MPSGESLFMNPVGSHRQAQVMPVAAARQPALVAYLRSRELWLPARLLGRGHAPLRFVLLHSLYLLTPIADLIGLTPQQGWVAWSEQFIGAVVASEPHGASAGATHDPA